MASMGSSTISSLHDGSLVSDLENPYPPRSSSIVRAPSVVRQQSQPQAQSSTATSDLPVVSGETRIQHKRDFLDRVFETVESTVCRVRHDRPEPAIIEKTVVVEGRQIVNLPANRQNNSAESRELPYLARNEGTPRRSILKKQKDDVFIDLENPQTEGDNNYRCSENNQDTKGDVLDYIFENIEGFVCRDKSGDIGHGRPAKGGGIDENDNSSRLKLHRLQKIPTRTDAGETIPVKPHRKDALDYMFECGRTDDTEQNLVIHPTPAEDRDILDYMFEGRGGEVRDKPAVSLSGQDFRDPSMRAPMSPERNSALSTIQMRDSNSIVNAPSHDSSRLSRLEMLRNKKRQLESDRMVEHFQIDDDDDDDDEVDEGSQPYLVPRGYKEKVSMSHSTRSISQSKSAEVLSTTRSLVDIQTEIEVNKRTRHTLIAVIVMCFTGVALIIVAVSFFFPLHL